MTRPIMPSAMSAETAERLSDDTHCYAYRPRKNRLVIDLEAHERAMADKDRQLAELMNAVHDVTKILKGDA